MSKQLKIDKFLRQQQESEKTDQDDSECNVEDIMIDLPNMTLEQFAECTNIRELLATDMRKKIPHLFQKKFREIDVFVRRAYQRYMSDPSYRKKKFFKDLNFSPKPWLTKRDNELRKLFKIESCYVDLSKDNIVKDIADICMKKGLSYHGEKASEAVKASIPSYIDNVFKRCIQRRKTFDNALKALKRKYSTEYNWSNHRNESIKIPDNRLPADSKKSPLNTSEYSEATQNLTYSGEPLSYSTELCASNQNFIGNHQDNELIEEINIDHCSNHRKKSIETTDKRLTAKCPSSNASISTSQFCQLSKKSPIKTSEYSKTTQNLTSSGKLPAYSTEMRLSNQNCISMNNFIKKTDIGKVLAEKLVRIYPELSENQKAFLINQYNKQLNDNRKENSSKRSDMMEMCIAFAGPTEYKQNVVSESISKNTETSHIVSVEFPTKCITSTSQPSAASLVDKPVSKQRAVKRKLDDIPHGNVRKATAIRSHDILPVSINIEDFKEQTNIKEYIHADIMKKFPVTYKKYLPKLDKFIQCFYNTFIKNMEKWPSGLYVKPDFRVEDHSEELLQETELVGKRAVCTDVSRLEVRQTDQKLSPEKRKITQQEQSSGDTRDKTNTSEKSKIFISPDVFASSSEEKNNEPPETLNSNVVYVGEELMLPFEETAIDPLQADMLFPPCSIIPDSSQPFQIFSDCSEIVIKEERTKSNETQQNELKLCSREEVSSQSLKLVKEDQMDYSDYENEVEFIPSFSPEIIVIPDQEMNVSLLLEEMMELSKEPVKDLSSVILETGRREHNNLKFVSTSPDKIPANLINHNMNMNSINEFHNEDATLAINSNHEISVDVNKEKNFNVKLEEIQSCCGTNNNMQNHVYNNNNLQTKSSQIEKIHKSPRYLKFRDSRLSQDKVPENPQSLKIEKEEQMDYSDYENEVEFIPRSSPEIIVIPDQEMNASLLLEEMMEPSKEPVKDLSSVILETGRREHNNLKFVSTSPDKIPANLINHNMNINSINEFHNEDATLAINSNHEISLDVNKEKNFNVKSGEIQNDCSTNTNMQNPVYDNNNLQTKSSQIEKTHKSPRYLKFLNSRLSQDKMPEAISIDQDSDLNHEQNNKDQQNTIISKTSSQVPSRKPENNNSTIVDWNQQIEEHPLNLKRKNQNKKNLLKKRKKQTDRRTKNEDVVPQKTHYFGPLPLIRKIRDINQVTCHAQTISTNVKHVENNDSVDVDLLIEDASQLSISPKEKRNSKKFTPSQLLNTDESFFNSFQFDQSLLKAAKNLKNTVSYVNVLPKTSSANKSMFTADTLLKTESLVNKSNHESTRNITVAKKRRKSFLYKKCLLPPQFGTITYLSLHQIVLNTKISHLKYESSVPLLKSFDEQSIQATINFRSNGFNQLNIYGQSLRFLLGLTQNEWSCFRNILQAIESFKYQPNDPEPVNKSLPYRVLYYLFKTLPKFAQVNFEFEDSNINDVSCFKISASYYKPVGCLSDVLDSYVLESMEKIKKKLYS